MFLLALMMSSCPGDEGTTTVLSNDSRSQGNLKKEGNTKKESATEGVKDSSKDMADGQKIKKEDSSSKQTIPSKIKSKPDLSHLKKKMEERGISFEKIVKEDVNQKKFVEIYFVGNMFDIIYDEDLSSRRIPISIHELSKYFQPFLQKKEGIDYLVLFDEYNQLPAITLDNLEDYELGIEEEFDRFIRNLHYFDKDSRYIDTLSDSIISSNSSDLLEELLVYLKNLEYFINKISLDPEDGYVAFEEENFNNENFYNKESRKIVVDILRDHKFAFRKLFVHFNNKDVLSDQEDLILRILDNFIVVILSKYY